MARPLSSRCMLLLALAALPLADKPGYRAYGAPAKPAIHTPTLADATGPQPEQGIVEFSGYRWRIISQKEKRGPGPNIFDAGNVSIDPEGSLVLETRRRSGRWTSAHVFLAESLGYGSYEIRLAPQEMPLDRRAVFGFFTWDEDPAFANREIDIELARWDSPTSANLHYTVQPAEGRPERGAALEFDFSVAVTLRFEWLPDSVSFSAESERGSFYWTFSGIGAQAEPFGVPPKGNEKVGLNLWLFRGLAPKGPSRIVVERFEFSPAGMEASR
jgi:hypothetical protein